MGSPVFLHQMPVLRGEPDFGEIIGTIRDWLAEKYDS